MFSQDILEKAKEARVRALPKAVYSDAVQRFCEECSGVNPATTDCEAPNCNLYPLNTREKRRKTSKTALRKAIRGECKHCLGGHDQSTCISAACKLYPFRLPAKNHDCMP